jgi:GNAT superfamily N-acetyltransferase
MTSLRIRKVKPLLVKDLCDKILYYETGESTWTRDGEYWAVLDDRDKVIAFGGLKPSRNWSDTVFFHCSGVTASARGHGIQKKLIKVRLSWAKRKGYAWAITYTLVDNPASSASLISCGFKPYWPKNPWVGNVCYWRRKL